MSKGPVTVIEPLLIIARSCWFRYLGELELILILFIEMSKSKELAAV
jgi:hypothetical protein